MRKKIAVAPEAEFQARRRLFGLLSELYPVDFISEPAAMASTFDAAIVWGDLKTKGAFPIEAVPECLLISAAEEPIVSVEKATVKFGSAASLDPCFRDQTMIDECLGSFPALRVQEADEVICAVHSRPYWIERRMGRSVVSVIALAPEEFAEQQTVYDHFNRRRWVRLLPVLHFLKRLVKDSDWETPPVRACLMFDDPNLHWPTYGFIDLRKLVRHAQEFNYHVCSAMVPLDGWFVSAPVAALFKEHKANISLCMHGNDHAYVELGAPLDADGFTKLLAQGLRRIEAFEKRSGVPVSRVMVPPYGAFREEVADPMLNLRYHAACVSRASLTAWNKNKVWPPSFGHPVAEFVGSGLPVIPRHVMAPGHEGAYRLAAFLNQPIIPHGHHQDCADGFDLLANIAGCINSLGNVIWSDMASLSRSNYLLKRNGDSLMIKMLARHISVPISANVKEIAVERPWISGGNEPELLICSAGNGRRFSARAGGKSPMIPIEGGCNLEVISPPPHAIDPRQVKPPSFQVWSTARRILSEARDRIAPLKMGRKPAVHSNGNGQVEKQN
jgi:hypothetical protein